MEITSVESVAAPSSGGKFQFTLNQYMQEQRAAGKQPTAADA
jgi:hypothetical protein